MDFGFRSIATEASNMFSRAKQFTEEKLGSASRTEYDPEFEEQLKVCERIGYWTEQMVGQAEALVVPDLGIRIEGMVAEKLGAYKTARPTNTEILGQYMLNFGDDLNNCEITAGIPYSSALLKVGRCQQELGVVEHDFEKDTHLKYIEPLKNFLNGDMKVLAKEKALLETKRLDLDVWKTRVKKATESRQSAGAVDNALALAQAQTEYDSQLAVTRKVLASILSTSSQHLKHLSDFIILQMDYHAKCQRTLFDIHADMVRNGICVIESPTSVRVPETNHSTGALNDLDTSSSLPLEDSSENEKTKVERETSSTKPPQSDSALIESDELGLG